MSEYNLLLALGQVTSPILTRSKSWFLSLKKQERQTCKVPLSPNLPLCPGCGYLSSLIKTEIDSHKEKIPDQGGRDLHLTRVLRPLVICDLELEGFACEDEEKGFLFIYFFA